MSNIYIIIFSFVFCWKLARSFLRPLAYLCAPCAVRYSSAPHLQFSYLTRLHIVACPTHHIPIHHTYHIIYNDQHPRIWYLSIHFTIRYRVTSINCPCGFRLPLRKRVSSVANGGKRDVVAARHAFLGQTRLEVGGRMRLDRPQDQRWPE